MNTPANLVRFVSRPAPARGAQPASANSCPDAEGPTVAVVTCHNYGRFLRQCLDSLLAQTVPFAAIVVVDDASTDGTPEICEEYARRVRVLRGEWFDFTKARIAGLQAARDIGARFLLFVDADNYLSSNFHEELLRGMESPRVGVVYPRICYFSDEGYQRPREDLARQWDYAQLRAGNFVDACALIRMEAYEQVGGWETVLTQTGPTDWLLWLKISRYGWTLEPRFKAVLHYRRHGKNMGMRRGALGRDQEANEDVMRRGAMIAIVTLFSGRMWQLQRYSQALRNLRWQRENLRVVAVDNSRCPVFALKLREALCKTGLSFTIVHDAGQVIPSHSAAQLGDDAKARTANGYAMSAHLARLYARARQEIPAGADFVWCLEDDIEPPADALDHLTSALLFHPTAGAVSGCVQNRFSENLIAWRGEWKGFVQSEKTFPVKAIPKAVQPILCSGMMCTLLRRNAWECIAFRPSPLWDKTRFPWYDWAAGFDLHRAGWEWLLSGRVVCGHWQANGQCLIPPEQPSATQPCAPQRYY